MKSLIFIFLIIFANCEADTKEKQLDPPGIEKEGEVYILNETNFDDFVKTRFVLVYFWNDKVKTSRFVKDFGEAAEMLKKEDKRINLARVHYETEQKILDKYGISSPNTYKLFRNGYMSDYQGSGLRLGLLTFCEKRIKHYEFPILNHEEDFEAVKKNNTGVFIVYFGNNPVKQQYLEKISYMDDYEDVNFYVMYDVYSILRLKFKTGTVGLFKVYDEKQDFFNETMENFTEEKLLKFVEDNCYPLMQSLDSRVYAEIHGTKYPYAVLFQAKEGESDESKLLNEFAMQYKGKIKFCNTTTDGFQARRLSKQVLVEETPTFAIIDGRDKEKGMKKYKLKEKITKENVEKFLGDFMENKLKPYFRSRTPPEKQGSLRVIVGDTYDKEIFENDKDVFVKFYADWCGHCKRLAPTWEELAETLKDNKDLVIAEYEADSNEHEGVKITSFPTIQLFKAGEKDKPIKYKGARTIEAFTEFLKENCKHPIVIPEKKEEDKKEDKPKTDL